MPRLTRLLFMALPLFALGGCIKFGTKPPPQLLSLSAPAALEETGNIEQASSRTIALVAPQVPRKLATPRVAVQANDTGVAYIKDAQWVDMPRNLFRALLAENLTTAGQFVVDQDQPFHNANIRLTGNLMEFGIDARTKKAVVVYEATMSFTNSEKVLRRRFTSEVPVRKIDAKRVAEPISEAAQQVAAEVAAWVKEN